MPCLSLCPSASEADTAPASSDSQSGRPAPSPSQPPQHMSNSGSVHPGGSPASGSRSAACGAAWPAARGTYWQREVDAISQVLRGLHSLREAGAHLNLTALGPPRKKACLADVAACGQPPKGDRAPLSLLPQPSREGEADVSPADEEGHTWAWAAVIGRRHPSVTWQPPLGSCGVFPGASLRSCDKAPTHCRCRLRIWRGAVEHMPRSSQPGAQGAQSQGQACPSGPQRGFGSLRSAAY